MSCFFSKALHHENFRGLNFRGYKQKQRLSEGGLLESKEFQWYQRGLKSELIEPWTQLSLISARPTPESSLLEWSSPIGASASSMVAAERGNLPSVLGGFSNQADKTHCIENAICCLSSKLVRASTRLKNNQHFSSSTLCLSIAVATLLVSSSVDAIEFTTPKTGHL